MFLPGTFRFGDGMRKREVWEKSHMGTLNLKLQLGLRKQRCTIAV